MGIKDNRDVVACPYHLDPACSPLCQAARLVKLSQLGQLRDARPGLALLAAT